MVWPLYSFGIFEVYVHSINTIFLLLTIALHLYANHPDDPSMFRKCLTAAQIRDKVWKARMPFAGTLLRRRCSPQCANPYPCEELVFFEGTPPPPGEVPSVGITPSAEVCHKLLGYVTANPKVSNPPRNQIRLGNRTQRLTFG